jgi:hypothetical protein
VSGRASLISESVFCVKYIFKSFTELLLWLSPKSSLRRQSDMSFFQRPLASFCEPQGLMTEIALRPPSVKTILPLVLYSLDFL